MNRSYYTNQKTLSAAIITGFMRMQNLNTQLLLIVRAMVCRERWGGLEAEGYGIVFVEAAACGVPSVAGRSGGSHEAVVDGETGFVVDPHDAGDVRAALERLLGDDALRERLGAAARTRAVQELTYDRQVDRLLPLTRGDLAALSPLR